MINIIITKPNGYGGITEEEYNDIYKYRITDDFIILEDPKLGGSLYIPKDSVVEFEVEWQA